MRPTGKLHLGHLVGALENWVALQGEYDNYHLIADYHALTTSLDTSLLYQNSIDMLIDWLSAGIDPKKSPVFRQSQIKEHTELHLLFSMLITAARLERNPTVKEQVRDLNIESVSYAFLGYPVLQAADILLYKGNVVPVGEDQLPHLELAREIVRKFATHYGEGIFPEPAGKLTETPRLMGLDNTRMAKSKGNTIDLSEDLVSVEKKVKGMFTDPNRKKRSAPGNPAVCNVYAFHGILNAKERTAVIETDCKTA